MKNLEKYDLYGVKSGKTSTERKKSAFSHSRYYHRYFQGYTEIMDETGRITRVYTAPWRVQDCSDREWIRQKIVYAALYLLAVLFVAIGLSLRTPGNLSWIVSLPGLPAVILTFLAGAHLVSYLWTGRKMTPYEERASSNLKLFTVLAAALNALTALMEVAVGLFQREMELGFSVVTGLLVLLGAAALFAINRMEAKARYIELENDTPIPAGGSMIR